MVPFRKTTNDRYFNSGAELAPFLNLWFHHRILWTHMYIWVILPTYTKKNWQINNSTDLSAVRNNTGAPNNLYNAGPVRNKSDTVTISERNIYQWHWYCWESTTLYILYHENASRLKVQSHLYFLSFSHPWWKLTIIDNFNIIWCLTPNIFLTITNVCIPVGLTHKC